ncbi:fungal specific transcription factor domain-containing protein [Colletotrichum plurivorum]|uniref:Fungal specific transcription factor domain-containing protein n=1 Tax=Colletotrichum plurivorum TaxID=2175906 RepID=A0A8H6J6V9_9PEZI|nr:fungal specific transcription factor domain-containing protein [Colletotrichum plurivorum]
MKTSTVLLAVCTVFFGSADAWWCTSYGKKAYHLSCTALYPGRNTFCCSAQEGGDRHTWRGDCYLEYDTPCGNGGFEGCANKDRVGALAKVTVAAGHILPSFSVDVAAYYPVILRVGLDLLLGQVAPESGVGLVALHQPTPGSKIIVIEDSYSGNEADQANGNINNAWPDEEDEDSVEDNIASLLAALQNNDA